MREGFSKKEGIFHLADQNGCLRKKMNQVSIKFKKYCNFSQPVFDLNQ